MRICVGDIVRHFKRETLSEEDRLRIVYLYKIIGFAEHTETGERMVVYHGWGDRVPLHFYYRLNIFLKLRGI